VTCTRKLCAEVSLSRASGALPSSNNLHPSFFYLLSVVLCVVVFFIFFTFERENSSLNLAWRVIDAGRSRHFSRLLFATFALTAAPRLSCFDRKHPAVLSFSFPLFPCDFDESARSGSGISSRKSESSLFSTAVSEGGWDTSVESWPHGPARTIPISPPGCFRIERAFSLPPIVHSSREQPS